MKAWLLAGAAMVVSAVLMAVTELPGLSPFVVVVVSDFGQLGAAFAAAIAAAYAARRLRGRLRRGWHLVAVGTGAWGLGQAVWTYYEVALREEVPFPSLADVGYLVFPVAAGAGLLLWRGTEGGLAGRGRDLLDGSIIAGSLLVLSWVTTLGSVVGEGGANWTDLSLSVAYPVTDVVLGTLVLLALARGSGSNRDTLMLLGAGLGCLAAADSAYVYLLTVESYSSADIASMGWVAGFLLVAAGGLHAASEGRERRRPGRPTQAERDLALESELELELRPWRFQLLLPYIPLVIAGSAICLDLLTAPVTPVVELSLGIVLVSLVLVRQLLAMSENQRLLLELRKAHSQVRHQALHDHLTGLANRALFTDRVAEALSLRGAQVSVLFCDVDDFKNINDQLGHEAGDTLLQLVSQRLQKCVRPGDTAARLGGDEFAVLLQDADDPEEIAERIVAAIQLPYQLDGAQVRSSISVGLASQLTYDQPEPEHTLRSTTIRRRRSSTHRVVERERPPTTQERAQSLLKRADVAMYSAKAAGKGRVAIADAVNTEGPIGRSRTGSPGDDEGVLASITHIGGRDSRARPVSAAVLPMR